MNNLLNVEVLKRPHTNVDFSELDAYENSSDEQEQEYHKWNQVHKNEYGSTWWMENWYARATVGIRTGNGYRVICLETQGVDNIESGMDRGVVEPIARQECQLLKELLRGMYLDVTDFEAMAQQALDNLP